MSYDEILRIIERFLEENGFKVELDKCVYKDFKADLFATKKDTHVLVLVKLNRDDILSTLTNAGTYISLPGISQICIATPSELIQQDIVKIAEYMKFGLYSIKEGKLEQMLKSKTLPGTSLSFAEGFPNSVLPGQTFEVNVQLNAGLKIVQNVEVSCIVGLPFTIEEHDSASKKIEELKSRESVALSFKVKVDKEPQPGKYPVFIGAMGDRVPFRIHMLQILIKEKDEDTIKLAVHNALKELDYATTTNLERVLSQIEEAVLDDVIDIKDNILGKSVWNDIGTFCFNNGLYKQAELVYGKMLETIRKQESRSGARLHKGLALHNLGLSLYFQGRLDEAKRRFAEAFQEDRITYGKGKAEEMPAKKALTELFYGPQ